MSPSARVCFSLGLAVSLSLGCARAAEDELDEIIVTASLGETPLSQLPASVTVLDHKSLTDAGLTHFGDVLGLVPNLGFAGGTSRPRYFQLRGIGELEQYEGAPNPSVGFLIDDIDFSGIAMPASLFDMERAEVLRGPQGTTYGANALAGLISLRSQAPRDAFELGGELEYGNYDTWGGGLVLNNTLDAGGSAWRLAVHHHQSDGFRHNAYLDRDDTNGFNEDFARLRLRSSLTPSLQMNLTVLLADADNGYDAWSDDNSRVTQTDQPGRDSQRTHAAALRFDYDGWDRLLLRSVTTFNDADMFYSFDGDWGNDVLWGVNGPYDFTEQIDRTRHNLSQELRLTSRPDAQGQSWIAGVYAMRLTEAYAFLDLSNGDVYRALDSNYRALNLAAYGQLDRPLTQRLSLSAGLRVERREARYRAHDRDGNALGEDPVDNMGGGHLALNWHVAQGRDAYVALTRGYKAGGINTGIVIPADQRLFDPESLWNIELGFKTRSADARFDSQTSLFYMRRSNQQVSSSVQAVPSDPNTFVLLTDNAARGENFGIESQLGWQALPTLRLGATIGLLRARFIDYTQGDRVLDGRDQPHAPHYQLGVSADWHDARGFFARADWQAVDGLYFSASHDQRASAYQLVNLRLGYETRGWSGSFWVRNLFNERYAVRGFYFQNEPPDFPYRRYIQNGDPRQIGLRLSFAY
jgi:outer membrane receptor protein involved in Fe transport